jgi:dTDP-4-dehydrorhamnose reductase
MGRPSRLIESQADTAKITTHGHITHMHASTLIIGAGGRLGSVLSARLARHCEVRGLNHSQLDLCSPAAIIETLRPLDFTHVFITAALTAVDHGETHEDEAFAVNAAAPGIIAEIAGEKGAHVTHISTDMVFDGLKDGPYVETDEAHPISVYGKSKLEGERRVLSASARNLVARVSWVFGPGRPAFPEWIIGQASAKTGLTLPGNKIACPTYTVDLIEWLDALVFGNSDGPAAGLFHLCNSDPCTWRDWGQYCIDTAQEAGLPVLPQEITGIPVDSVAAFVARRPVNSAMDTRKFSETTGIHPRSWREAIREHVMHNLVPVRQSP